MSTLRTLFHVLASALAASVVTHRAGAQCLDWSPAFGRNGIEGAVHAIASFDDGNGPAVYVGGILWYANGIPVQGIAKWNGSTWSALGEGVHGEVDALAVFDDGHGPVLYVAGSFDSAGGVAANGIARWNGTAWSGVSGGLEGSGSALTVFDDGNGPALYVGGNFVHAGSVEANNIARWNGAHWSALGGGIAGFVAALQAFDSGSGPELVVGGYFTLNTGGPVANNIARWNGSSWSALGLGTNGYVFALTVHDAGDGPAICAGGVFTVAGGASVNHVARWDGATWSPLGSGANGDVHTLASFDGGSGPGLFAGGPFTAAGGVVASRIARWDGSTWADVGGGVNTATFAIVLALAPVALGNSTALFVGGSFAQAGDQSAHNVASWDGAQWQPLGPTDNGTLDAGTLALTMFDDGSGPALYAGGVFGNAGGESVNNVARWNGAQWSSLGTGIGGSAAAIEAFDDGSGPALYVGGNFATAGGMPANKLAKWDGASWSEVPGFAAGPPSVTALEAFDDGSGSALFVGGTFTSVGGVSANHIAKWNGSAWSDVGGGVTAASGGSVTALGVYDDGSGPALYVSGIFDAAGGVLARNIARWNGSSWSALGSGVNNAAYALLAFDDGGGSALYVGGNFTNAGGNASSRIARWNGSTWSPLSTGMNDAVSALVAFDDGAGAALYAGGNFTQASGAVAYSIARWNGAQWLPVGGGLGDSTYHAANALAVFDDGAGGGADLYAGGTFTHAANVSSFNFAEWRGCAAAQASFCAGDGSSVACPCGNSGASGRGCQNSATTGGASLAASGTTVPDTIVLSAAHELPNALSIFLQGDAVISAAAFGDGLRCTGGQLKRLYVKTASGGAATAPQVGDPSVSAQSASLGDPIAPGATRFYQTYYRDPNFAYCPLPAGNSWNVTNAMRLRW